MNEPKIRIKQKIDASKTPMVFLINKIDLVDQDEANSLIDYWKNKVPNAIAIPLSALKKFNIDSLKKEILELLPESPPYFPKDTLTDKSERFIVSEIVREKILERYKQEIPYSVEVVVDSFKDKGKVIVIDATIYVERESQKVIVLGKKGIAIKSVGTAARKTLQNFFKKKIFLGLFVKVSKDWRSRKSQLKKFGYN